MTSGEVVVAVLIAILGGGSLLGILVSKLVPQRTGREDRIKNLEEKVGRLEDRLDQERAERQDDHDEARAVINEQADYIMVLRGLVPPPPPEWPEGLRIR